MNPKFHLSTEASVAATMRPVVPDHELICMIGGGSYGQIWLARNVVGVFRAVKVVSRSSFQSDRPYQREFEGVQRFEPISRSHEGFLQILHIGRNDAQGFFYYVMELADSQNPDWKDHPERYLPATLSNELDRVGALGLQRCVEVALALSAALIRLHSEGLVHRDLKPANVVFVAGKPKLADVGLVTEAGVGTTFVGTEGYVPREGPGQPSADIYALGRMLYELSTGIPCSEFPRLPELPPTAVTGISFAEFNEVMCRCCEEDVTKRYQKAEEVFWHFSLLQRGTSVKRLLLFDRVWRQGRRYAMVGVLLFVMLAVAAHQAWQSHLRDRELLQRTIGTFVTLGNQAMGNDSGDGDGRSDPAAALPSFVAALKLSRGDPDAEDAHRVRVASALDRTPSLKQVWFGGRESRSASFGTNSDWVLLPIAGGYHQMFEVSTGRPVGVKVGSGAMDEMAMLHPDGQRVLTSSRNEKVVRVASCVTGGPPVKIAFDHYISHAEWSPDGMVLGAASSQGGSVNATLVRMDGGERVRLHGHTGPLQHITFSPDGQLVATSGRDQWVRIHEVQSGMQVGAVGPHASWVNWAAFSPDGKRIATASFDRTIRVWRVEDFHEVTKVPLLHSGGVRVVEFSPDGRQILAGTFDFTVQFWDVESGQAILTPLHHAEHVIAARFAPSVTGREVLTLTQEGVARVWEMPGPIQEYQRRGRIVEMARKGDLWIERGLDGWGIQSFRSGQVSSIRGPSHGGEWTQISLTYDGQGWVGLAEKLEGQNKRQILGYTSSWRNGPVRELGEVGEVTDVQTHSIAQGCIISGKGGVQRWDLNRDKRLWKLEVEGWSRTILGPLGRNLAVLGKEQGKSNLKVIDLETGAVKFSKSYAAPLELADVDFAPDEHRMVIALKSSIAKSEAALVLETSDGRVHLPSLTHRDGVMAASYSHDGRRIMTSGEDQRAVVWDVETGAQVSRPMAHLDQVAAVAWSGDDRWVATLSSKHQVRVWDGRSGDPISPTVEVPGGVQRIAFVGERAAVVGWGGKGGSVLIPLRRENRAPEELGELAAMLSAQQEIGLEGGRWATESEQKAGWDRIRGRMRQEVEK